MHGCEIDMQICGCANEKISLMYEYANGKGI
jgi:hypothetical protein